MARRQEAISGPPLIRIIDLLAEAEGVSLEDPGAIGIVSKRLAGDLAKLRNSPIVIHGTRTQSMFAHVAFGLAQTELITEEDSGELYAADSTIRCPDYRVVTKKGDQFLIEVKNHYRKQNVLKEFVVKGDYLDGLRRYADHFCVPLRVATYWARWNIWTLVSPKFFTKRGSKRILSFKEALLHNQMVDLGDREIATIPPLELRFVTNPDHPRKVGSDGMANCAIKSVEIIAGDELVNDSKEQSLALFLMLYGRWGRVEEPAIVQGDELVAFGFKVNPVELPTDQPFAMLGPLSAMLSRQYRAMTTDDGRIARLIPKQDLVDLDVLIPSDYSGSSLKIWRFEIQPKHAAAL